jgi:hypothetical protein
MKDTEFLLRSSLQPAASTGGKQGPGKTVQQNGKCNPTGPDRRQGENCLNADAQCFVKIPKID